MLANVMTVFFFLCVVFFMIVLFYSQFIKYRKKLEKGNSSCYNDDNKETLKQLWEMFDHVDKEDYKTNIDDDIEV